jgi:hypothetical protein
LSLSLRGSVEDWHAMTSLMMLKGAISSTKGPHVTRNTCCDWRRTYVTGVTLMQPETHICDWSHILVMSFVTGVANTWLETQYATALAASSLGDMLIRIAYIADHLGLISISPLMYYFTFTQATLIHLHNKTRLALVTHHYYCLGTSSNQPWWI